MFDTDIGIDLGTASILVYIKGKGVVLKEPSVVAIDRDTDTIRAIGEEARLMIGRTPGNIVAVRPLRQGVISNYSVTEQMIKYFIQKAVGKRSYKKPRISICVPSGATEVETKAVEDASFQAGAREVFIVEEPLAAAIGAGIDISKPCGNMVVDIGGGTTDIAVISLGATVESTSVKVAGDDFDDAIVRYMRKKHNLLVGERTAEEIKIGIGTCFKKTEVKKMEVRGRNLVTGLPKIIEVTSEEVEEALREATTQIVEAIHGVLEGKGKVITVVGAGGNRDKGKRPIMAKEAAKASDRVIITSDNPRFEEPQDIINDMLAGLDAEDMKKTLSIADRKEAIRTACMLAEKGDVILVAGKGHENYQEIKGVKHHFDDKEVLKEIFK